MSLYKSTNEMFNNSSLYHSDTYLGNDYTDGIKHWKYIKREKKNGRWVYYYKDDNLNKLKKERDYDLNALKYENKKRGYGNDSYSHYIHNGKKVGNDAVYKKLKRDATYSSGNYSFAKYKSDKRKKVYNTLLISPLNTVSKTINKGKNFLSSLLKKR